MSIVKTLKYILPVIATAIMAAGCAEEELYTPGLSDTENNYGVYFPSQTSPTQLDLDPSDETEVKKAYSTSTLSYSDRARARQNSLYHSLLPKEAWNIPATSV